MIMALMTKAKKPRVIIVSGSPKRLKIGFKIRFKTPKTTAKITAPVNSSKCTPDNTFVSRKATIAVMKSRMIMFIFLFLNLIFSLPKFSSKLINPTLKGVILMKFFKIFFQPLSLG